MVIPKLGCFLKTLSFLNHIWPMLFSRRNQSIDLHCKSIGWFLHQCNTGLNVLNDQNIQITEILTFQSDFQSSNHFAYILLTRPLKFDIELTT